MSPSQLKEFNNQNKIIENKIDHIDFLRINAQYFGNEQFCIYLENEIRLPLVYNLYKLYIVKLRQLNENIKIEQLIKENGKMRWDQFLKTPIFERLSNQIKKKIRQAELKFQDIYSDCQQNIQEIVKINSSFRKSFNKKITQKSFISN